MSDRYAVIGNPIEHSKSPSIHAAFARQTGEDIQYGRLLGDLDRFGVNVRDFFTTGGRGLNVTLPFKEQAWDLSDRLSEAARRAGAVNTLHPLDNGELFGNNTDGIGLVRDLTQNHGLLLGGCRILLLGAGGAAKGVVGPLLAEGPELLHIANRTPAKAEALALVAGNPELVRGSGLDELQGGAFDLIINATAAGLQGSTPDIPASALAPGGWTYDLMYGREPTAFVRWGAALRATKALDGLGMLVEQAAESFFIWRGVRPTTGPVIAELRQRM